MSELKYTKEHEWVLLEGDVATVGITDFAQEQLGDIVFIDLPEKEQQLTAGQEAVVIESVKAAGEVNAPFAGTVIEINEQLVETPELVNEDPAGDGWFYKVHIAGDINLGELMNETEYTTYVNDQ